MIVCSPSLRFAAAARFMEESKISLRPLFGSWVRATTLGWALGVPAIVLFSVMAESLGQHSLHTPVGAGMGLAVGFFQSRAIRRWGLSEWPWFWSCLIGLTTPFLAADLLRLVGVEIPYSLNLSVVVAGFIAGVSQAVLLRPRFTPPAAWVAAAVLGWSLASGSVALADRLVRFQALRGIPGALAYLGLVASGGLVLAVITGLVLVGRLRPEPEA